MTVDRYKKIRSLVEEVRGLLEAGKKKPASAGEKKSAEAPEGEPTHPTGKARQIAQGFDDAHKLAGKKISAGNRYPKKGEEPKGSRSVTHFVKDYTDKEKEAHAAHKQGGIDEPAMGKLHGKGSKHNPFRNLKKGKNLGPAVRGDATHPGSSKGLWRCRCSAYKCHCIGKDESNKGQKKNVFINKAYKARYNILYRKWRKIHANKYAPGKDSRFKKRPKVKKETE
jgi:hypothetical protein